MSRFQVDGVDVRIPVLVVSLVGALAGASIARGGFGAASVQAPPGSAQIVGTASVIDGDTLEIHGIRIRLDGIDAPESRQTCRREGRAEPCGRTASHHLADQIARRPINCSPQGTDRYGRTLAICYLNGEDLNAMMVRDGQAVAYRYFSMRYAATEDAARRARIGIWGTMFEMPFDWRRKHR